MVFCNKMVRTPTQAHYPLLKGHVRPPAKRSTRLPPAHVSKRISQSNSRTHFLVGVLLLRQRNALPLPETSPKHKQRLAQIFVFCSCKSWMPSSLIQIVRNPTESSQPIRQSPQIYVRQPSTTGSPQLRKNRSWCPLGLLPLPPLPREPIPSPLNSPPFPLPPVLAPHPGLRDSALAFPCGCLRLTPVTARPPCKPGALAPAAVVPLPVL